MIIGGKKYLSFPRFFCSVIGMDISYVTPIPRDLVISYSSCDSVSLLMMHFPFLSLCLSLFLSLSHCLSLSTSHRGLFLIDLHIHSHRDPLLQRFLAIKGESLPSLDRLLPSPLPQTPVNEPVRLAPVPAWRKVKSVMPIETN